MRQKSRKGDPYKVTRRKICRILRFIQKRKIPVEITYAWFNSIGHSDERKYNGVIDRYEVHVVDPSWDCYVEFDIVIYLTDGSVIKERIDNNYRFYEFNKNPMKQLQLYFCNSGPYCWFTIERMDIEK